jgi:hypothetical protein
MRTTPLAFLLCCLHADPLLADPQVAAQPPQQLPPEGQTKPTGESPQETDFRAHLQRARKLLADFEISRRPQLEPRGWHDPLLGLLSAPETGVRELSTETEALAGQDQWQPRQRLTFRPDGQLQQVLTWSTFGRFEERVDFSYDEQGRLRTRWHYADPDAQAAPSQRLTWEPRDKLWQSQLWAADGLLVCTETCDAEGRLLSQTWPQQSNASIQAERDAEGRLLGISEQIANGTANPLLLVRHSPPLSEFSLLHQGEIIPFRLRIQGPQYPGQTIDVELEPQGVRLELHQRPSAAEPTLEHSSLGLRVWQPPRRGSRPLFPRFEPAWLERGPRDAESGAALDFHLGLANSRLELSSTGTRPAEGALRFVPSEFKQGLWTAGQQERYSRARQAWEPAGLRVRRAWTR